MIKPYRGICKQCNKEELIQNSKGIGVDCTYRNSHDGKSAFEVNMERQKQKQKEKIYSISRIVKKPLNSTKNYIKRGVSEKRKKILQKDRDLYLYIFNNTPHVCEETGQMLPGEFEDENGNIIAIWQYSHILTKAAWPEFRHHRLNINRLSLVAHQDWEYGDRESMNIFKSNQERIKKIKENPLDLI